MASRAFGCSAFAQALWTPYVLAGWQIIFPNDASIARLVGAMTAKSAAKWYRIANQTGQDAQGGGCARHWLQIRAQATVLPRDVNRTYESVSMPKQLRWNPWALVAIFFAGMPVSGAFAAEASAVAGADRDPMFHGPMSANERQEPKAESGPELWRPEGQPRRAPTDLAQQHAELLRVMSIPLPSFEDRRYLNALMGIGADDGDSVKGNADWFKHYLGKRPAPTAAEQKAFLEGLKHELIFVQGGDFMMGDFGTLTKYKLRIAFNKSTEPHKVTLDSYSLMRGTVTNGEYDFYSRMTGTSPVNVEWVDIFSRFPGYVARPITWPQADNYCRWLADFTKMPFALPTEAQWEYAARERGKFVAYPAYNMPGVKWASEYIPEFQSLDAVLTSLEARAGQRTDMTEPAPPDLHGANRIGMEGSLGDAVEWMSDWYEEKPNLAPSRNPKGPSFGNLRVVRFGAYGEYQATITRTGWAPDVTHHETQFRCVLNAGAPWN